MSTLNLDQTESLLKELTLQAGKIIIEKWPTIKITNLKAHDEIQTNLDQEIENFLISNFKKHYPDHHFYAEESGQSETKSDYTWYIDPIDGTQNCFHKIPLFAISIALAHKDELLLSTVYNPLTHEFFFARKGAGSFVTRTTHEHFFDQETTEKLSVSKIDTLQKATIQITIPKRGEPNRDKEIDQIKVFMEKSARIRNLGSIALALCYTAQGAYEACCSTGSHVRPYDLAGGILMIKEAGGQVTNRQGALFSLNEAYMVASNGVVHQELMKIFA